MSKSKRSLPVGDMIRKHLTKDVRGATMIEYALLASLVSIAALGILQLIGPQIASTFNRVLVALQTAGQ